MDMGTILEGTPPCMEDPEETGKIAPDVFPVVVEFFYGLGGRFEKGRTGDPLVAPDEPAQTLGNSEGDHEMMAGKPAGSSGFQATPGFSRAGRWGSDDCRRIGKRHVGVRTARIRNKRCRPVWFDTP